MEAATMQLGGSGERDGREGDKLIWKERKKKLGKKKVKGKIVVKKKKDFTVLLLLSSLSSLELSKF